MSRQRVGVIGARSFLGEQLIPQLVAKGYDVVAYTRLEVSTLPETPGVSWRQLHSVQDENDSVSLWICAVPIWVLPRYFRMISALRGQRVIALSSTSRFTKLNAPGHSDRILVRRLIAGEKALKRWASASGIEWLIFQPTLIYGLGRDKNISEIARFMRRFRVFPILGQAKGLRQPVHVLDVAALCISALGAQGVTDSAYIVAGSEKLTYRAMLERVARALGLKVRYLPIPIYLFRLVFFFLKCLPRYRYHSSSIAERMNQDFVFDTELTERAFGAVFRGFSLESEDLPT